MDNILELQQVSKTFLKSDFTLDNVSFSLPYGAILGFVGENGAGYDDWLYPEYDCKRRRQRKAVRQGNDGR